MTRLGFIRPTIGHTKRGTFNTFWTLVDGFQTFQSRSPSFSTGNGAPHETAFQPFSRGAKARRDICGKATWASVIRIESARLEARPSQMPC